MGRQNKGRKGNASSYYPPKGKGVGVYAAPKAVPMSETFHVAVLRPYPAENGSMLIRRGGASRYGDLLTPQGLAERLSANNHEACNRPGVWLSTMAASLAHGLRVAQLAEEDPERAGLPGIAAHAPEGLLDALDALNRTQRRSLTDVEGRAALLEVLDYLTRQPAERLERGAPLDNSDPLPRAASSGLTSGLQLWAELNSWQICKQCHQLQPRELTLAGLEKILSRWRAKAAASSAATPSRPLRARQRLPLPRSHGRL